MLDKQSGVPGIRWSRHHCSWRVHYNKSSRPTCRAFGIQPYLQDGCSEDQAEASALQAAMAFHRKLVRQGVLRKPRQKRRSEVVGAPRLAALLSFGAPRCNGIRARRSGKWSSIFPSLATNGSASAGAPSLRKRWQKQELWASPRPMASNVECRRRSYGKCNPGCHTVG